MAGCSHDCSNCSEKCSKESLLAPQNQASNVKHVIGVVSGKGGVGKTLVTSMLAVTMQRRGYKAAILDADITGPSIPKAFGLKAGNVQGNDLGMFPEMTKTGIEVMSLNLLVDDETKPVVWRGPVIAGTVKQFWSDVVWNEVDYMFVDMPPGTGDVPLTVFQSLGNRGACYISVKYSCLVSASLHCNGKHRGYEGFSYAALTADNTYNALNVTRLILGCEKRLLRTLGRAVRTIM